MIHLMTEDDHTPEGRGGKQFFCKQLTGSPRLLDAFLFVGRNRDSWWGGGVACLGCNQEAGGLPSTVR